VKFPSKPSIPFRVISRLSNNQVVSSEPEHLLSIPGARGTVLPPDRILSYSSFA
jgi:hypothetical protein